jgi:hypothetical protein
MKDVMQEASQPILVAFLIAQEIFHFMLVLQEAQPAHQFVL